jgi:hypothetical protein
VVECKSRFNIAECEVEVLANEREVEYIEIGDLEAKQIDEEQNSTAG